MDNQQIPPLSVSDIQRFWHYVERKSPDECWPWKASKFVGGYGQFNAGGRTLRAHRVAFLLQHGIDPADKLVCHVCDNPPCCNGAHLFAGTNKDNIRDCVSKGRSNTASGWNHGSRTKPESRARGERVGGAKLTAEQVAKIRALYKAGEYTHTQLGERFGVSREAIGLITRGKNWHHIAAMDERVSLADPLRRGKPGEQHHKAKLSEEEVHQIRELHAAKKLTYKDLAQHFGVSKATIAFIIQGKTWQHVN